MMRPRIAPTLTRESDASIASTVFDIDDKLQRFISEEESDSSLFGAYPGAERTQYDYAAERRHFYSTNIIESTAHMIKGCLDVGILCIHEAYMWGGIWTSLGTTFILVFFSMYNTLLLVRIARKLYIQLRIPKMSYPDLVEAAVATGPVSLRRSCKCFRLFIETALFIELCSCCNVYQIMMASICKQIVEKMWLSTPIRLEYCILIVTVPIMCLCFIKKFKYLAPLSIVVDIFIIICVASSLAYSDSSTSISLASARGWRSVDGFFRFTGVLIYSVDGTTLALPIENYMTRPEYFDTVVWFAIPTVTVCGILVGVIGYWRFGETCVSPITMHMPLETYPITLEIIFVIVLAFSFAIHFWLPLRITWKYVARKWPKSLKFADIILRIFLVLCISVVSFVVPNIMNFISVIGNVVLSTITFIFPSFIDILQRFSPLNRLIWDRSVPMHVLRDILCIMIGFVLMGGGIYSLIKGYQ